MSDKPLWLLDVDGVLNADKPGWGGPPRKVNVAGFTIRWAPALLDRVRQVHRDGLADIRWSSTWCGYPDQLAGLERVFRLRLPRAFGDRPPNKTWAELKVYAVLDALAAGRRVVWTDDDEAGIAPSIYPQISKAEQDGRALLIAPRSNRGLQRDHLDAIETFCRADVLAEPT